MDNAEDTKLRNVRPVGADCAGVTSDANVPNTSKLSIDEYTGLSTNNRNSFNANEVGATSR